MSRFQLIFTGLLVVLGIGGAVLFAVSKNTATQGAPATVIWGTLDSQLVSNFISTIAPDNRASINVSYVQKNAATFESDLIAALARGAGPDMVLLPQDLIVKQLDKFYVVPFSTYSERIFKSSFIQEGELYLAPDGVIGFPFSVDPLVMYWNRDLFSDAGVAVPPTSWTELFTLQPKLTKKDANGNITQSLVAFGEARNVAHFKDVVALLALQAGTPIVATDVHGALVSYLDTRGASLVAGEEAVSFYAEFSNPTKASYSWNRSLPLDKNAFAAGKLALYFGYASELASIRAANPNLNFDVAPVPQSGSKRITFGNMSAIAILKASKNAAASFAVASAFASASFQQEWVSQSGFAPVRRDMLASLPGNAYQAVFYQSALVAGAWLDPNREATNDVFGRMIENVTSGKLRVSESVRGASQEIDTLLRAAAN